MSRRLGEEGRVEVEVQVQADGTASKVSLRRSSGYPRLDEAALEAIKRWKFIPAKRAGEAVAASVIVPMPFVLEK
jgi:protein TonB